MEMTVNTHAATVTTMSLVTEMMEHVRMGVKKAIEEVIVNSVSIPICFTDVLKTLAIELSLMKST